MPASKPESVQIIVHTDSEHMNSEPLRKRITPATYALDLLTFKKWDQEAERERLELLSAIGKTSTASNTSFGQ